MKETCFLYTHIFTTTPNKRVLKSHIFIFKISETISLSLYVFQIKHYIFNIQSTFFFLFWLEDNFLLKSLFFQASLKQICGMNGLTANDDQNHAVFNIKWLSCQLYCLLFTCFTDHTSIFAEH